MSALNNMHAQKVKSLMKSISLLKSKMKASSGQDKEHRRSALIKSLRLQSREKDLVIDVIKQTLKEKVSEFNHSTTLVCNDVVVRNSIK